jgi:Family of unknown function (DUF6186)
VSSAGVYAVWALFGALVLGLWAWSHTEHPPVARPSVVLEWLATRSLVRIVLVLGWMWLGWHLFAR